jgi:hypothetical protein
MEKMGRTLLDFWPSKDVEGNTSVLECSETADNLRLRKDRTNMVLELAVQLSASVLELWLVLKAWRSPILTTTEVDRSRLSIPIAALLGCSTETRLDDFGFNGLVVGCASF